MPEILIVAATKFEIEPLLNHYKIEAKNSFFRFENITFLITGVGMVNTSYHLGTLSGQKFDYAINVGICGAFERDLKIGEVVNVVSDTISEMGAEDGDEFIRFEDLNLGGTNIYRNKIVSELSQLREITKVKAITVNKVHGREQSIRDVKNLFLPDVESMEGAAFFRGCEGLSENVLQIRAISNYVEKRDKGKWNLPLAVKHVNEFVIELMTQIRS